MPPATTPQASAWPIVGISGPVPSRAVISDRLSRIGVAAGAANRPKRVEDAALQRRQRNEQEIGEGQPRELDGEIERSACRRSRAPAAMMAQRHQRSRPAGRRRAARWSGPPASARRRRSPWSGRRRSGCRRRSVRTPPKTRLRRTAIGTGWESAAPRRRRRRPDRRPAAPPSAYRGRSRKPG